MGYEDFNQSLDRITSQEEEETYREPLYFSSFSRESQKERIEREKREAFDWSRAFDLSYFDSFFKRWDFV